MGRMLSVPPRNLADAAYMGTKSEQQLFDVIKQGGPQAGLSPDMRAFGEQLSDQEIWDTIAYLRTLATSVSAATETTVLATPRGEASSPGLRLAHFQVSIWPEYDDPRVLVILRGQVASDSVLPTVLTLPIPQGADIIGAGMVSEQEELLVHPYQIVRGESEDRLELNLPTARFFVELYYNPLPNNPMKQFTYRFSSPYPIAQLAMEVQQPLRATGFVLTPAPVRQRTDQEGFTYHTYLYRNVVQKVPVSITISYTKATLEPSVAKRPPPPKAAAQSRLAVNPMFIAMGILIGAAVLIGGSTCLWQRYERRRHAPRLDQGADPALNRPSLSTAAASPSVGRTNRPNFCSHCGRTLQPTYQFCPGCGTSLP